MKLLNRRREVFSVGLILLLSIIWQLWIIWTGRAPFDGDMATMMMMGRGIHEGRLPIFFVGQDYLAPIESYLYALFILFLPDRTFLTGALVAIFQTQLFLILSYLFFQRFFSRRTALFGLIYLAFPPLLLADWYLRLRGYTPWLILGVGVMWQLIGILQQGEVSRRRWFWLGLTMGFAWYVNPLSVYYLVTGAGCLLAYPESRRQLLSGQRPINGLVNLVAFLWAILILSRSLIPARKSEFILWLYDMRAPIWAIAFVVVGGLVLILWRRREWNLSVTVICLSFLLGNGIHLWATWNQRFLNLKQSLVDLPALGLYLESAWLFLGGGLAGVVTIPEGEPIHWLWFSLPLIGIYLMMIYYVIRHELRKKRALQVLGLLLIVSVGLYLLQSGKTLYEHRYLLCVYLSLAAGFGVFLRGLERLQRGLGWIVLLCIVAFNISAFSKRSTEDLSGWRANPLEEQMLVDYCMEHALEAVYVDTNEEFAYRMNYLSGPETVALYFRAYFNRFKRFEEHFQNRKRYAVILQTDSSRDWVGQAPDAVLLDRYAVYHSVDAATIASRYPGAFGLEPPNASKSGGP